MKWAGGKMQILECLIEQMPDKFNNYYEPFVGGGALFLSIKPTNAIINDLNAELINIYKCIKDTPEALIQAIYALDSVTHNELYFLENRERFNYKLANGEMDVECASLMLWINRRCFNGLYRVNKKGLFNVGYNSRNAIKTVDFDNIREISKYLNSNNIQITNLDFEKSCESVSEGDFVYIDSPYIPISNTANFTSYCKEGFDMEDHIRVLNMAKELDKRGAYVMLSNNDTEIVRNMYKDFNIKSIDVARSINSKGDKRKGKEIIITNY